jgi:hypothetical protein
LNRARIKAYKDLVSILLFLRTGTTMNSYAPQAWIKYEDIADIARNVGLPLWDDLTQEEKRRKYIDDRENEYCTYFIRDDNDTLEFKWLNPNYDIDYMGYLPSVYTIDLHTLKPIAGLKTRIPHDVAYRIRQRCTALVAQCATPSTPIEKRLIR